MKKEIKRGSFYSKEEIDEKLRKAEERAKTRQRKRERKAKQHER